MLRIQVCYMSMEKSEGNKMLYSKKLEEVIIRVENEKITIIQEGLGPEEDHIIVLAPEQVDLVIKLLIEAKEHATKLSN